MGEPADILETTKVERNDAIRFASLTLANLDFLEDAWRSGQPRGGNSPVHLVTQVVNSLLGLVVFTCEKEYVRFTLKERLADLAAKGWPVWTFQLGGSPAETLGDLIYHLRNGASHARISFSSDSSLPSEVEITIEDASPKTKQVYWRVSISAAGLLQFCRMYGKARGRRYRLEARGLTFEWSRGAGCPWNRVAEARGSFGASRRTC